MQNLPGKAMNLCILAPADLRQSHIYDSVFKRMGFVEACDGHFWVLMRFVFLVTLVEDTAVFSITYLNSLLYHRPLGFIFHNKGDNQNVDLIGSLKDLLPEQSLTEPVSAKCRFSRRPEQHLAAGLNYARIFGIVHRRDWDPLCDSSKCGGRSACCVTISGSVRSSS